MKINTYLKKMYDVSLDERSNFVESVNIHNYASGILSETDMWILRTAADNAEYLENKLKEADELTLDKEAPSENEEDLNLDETSEDEELSLEEPTESGEKELSLDDITDDDPLSLDNEDKLKTQSDSAEDDEKPKIETSLEGAGILPLLADIQDKLANGKPSEVELAALKALKKLF